MDLLTVITGHSVLRTRREDRDMNCFSAYGPKLDLGPIQPYTFQKEVNGWMRTGTKGTLGLTTSVPLLLVE